MHKNKSQIMFVTPRYGKKEQIIMKIVSEVIKREREACADLVTGWFNDVPMDEPIDAQLIDLVNELGEAIRERK